MDDTNRILLKLENISKSFAKVENDQVTHALDQIDLQMESGEFISLVGPSGCGKSTVLRLVAGLIQPTLGKVTVNGEEVTGPSPERGMVFQKPTLFPWLTVLENVMFGLNLKKDRTKEENLKAAERYLESVGLIDFKDSYPYELSGGMKQRVAIIRSLLNHSPILLMDEPFSALDMQNRHMLQEQLIGVWKRFKNTIVFVTHDVDEAIYMGTRVIVMDANPGRIIADIKIEGDFPRDRSSENFIAYRNMILNRLHFAGKKHE